ncbi:MAG: NlpC/P60 family N-terminal domain-containing protein [Smithella sp.]|nr:NlpC/P60 family N-terminal domain-containing protein [Smithella sp.]
MKPRLLYCILTIIILLGCQTLPEAIQDERDLTQDHTAYVEEATAEAMFLLSPDAQAKMDADYNTIYFSVWHNSEPAHASLERVSSIFKRFSFNLGYGENKRKHSPVWLKKLQKNASLENYPNTMQFAITARHTNLRMMPTNGPHFYKPRGDISGWPFDNMQISSVPANIPLMVFHLSEDKSWALVETSFAFGWMPVEDFARVDENFMKAWESGRYAVVIKDKTSIYDAEGNFSLRTSIGQVFPLVNALPDKMEILIAAADENSNAIIKRGFVSPDVVAPKPLPFTYENAVIIANEMIDEPYGWGGLYGNRDCSAMTRDFFAPFGIWLPRHSEDQVKKVGSYIDLKDLKPDEKEKVIREKGVPYLSLLWRKGHVMLYIGEQNDRALIFHNAWGIRTKDFRGREGRKIIGKAVITTLCPGAELLCLDPEGLLIKNIAALTILAPQEKTQPGQEEDVLSSKNIEASDNSKSL